MERLALLTQMFAIDISAFALMSNHYHLVVRVDTAKAAVWSAQDIADRWQLLFRLPVLVERYLSCDSSSEAENQVTATILETWRTRLCDTKCGVINSKQPPLLARLGISEHCWLQNCKHLETRFHQVIGPISSLRQFCQKIGQRWLHGQTACQRSFG